MYASTFMGCTRFVAPEYYIKFDTFTFCPRSVKESAENEFSGPGTATVLLSPTKIWNFTRKQSF